ncbi:MAG: hypothetical protein K2X07_10760 [Caulobacteraceae bacterium]|nr:hypothetical protein [Caulobacteraceae bacterium]
MSTGRHFGSAVFWGSSGGRRWAATQLSELERGGHTLDLAGISRFDFAHHGAKTGAPVSTFGGETCDHFNETLGVFRHAFQSSRTLSPIGNEASLTRTASEEHNRNKLQ